MKAPAFDGPGDPSPPEAYGDRDGRRHQSPGAPPLRYDSVADYRAGRSADLPPGPDAGLLDVLICTAASQDRTGVLLIDGAPVAAGDGRYQLALAPGAHLLEVQGADAASAAFTVSAGERVRYTTGQGVAVRGMFDYRTRLYRVRDGADLVPVPKGRTAGAANTGCLLAVAGALLLLAGGITVSVADAEGALGTAAAVTAAIGALVLITGVTAGIAATRAFHKRAEAARLPSERTAPDAPGPLTGPAVAYQSPHDARDHVTTRGPLLVFDLFLYRVHRGADGASGYDGTGEALALAHAEHPACRIDGTAVPCDWAAWHYPLAPGEHRFRIDYGPASTEFTFDVSSMGDMAVLHVPVRVFHIWDEATGAFDPTPPQIAHRVFRRSKTIVGKAVDTTPGRTDDWTPTRIWTGG